MKTSHIILLVVGLALVGFLVYWFGFRRKPITPPVSAQPPVQNQTTAQSILGFAENAGKKAFNSFTDDLLGRLFN